MTLDNLDDLISELTEVRTRAVDVRAMVQKSASRGGDLTPERAAYLRTKARLAKCELIEIMISLLEDAS